MQKAKIKKPKSIRNYIDNDKFFEAVCDYKRQLKAAREAANGEEFERPVMSDYLGDCFLKLAENFSHNYSFIGYPFREDMVMDAVYFCVKYIDTFNPERTKNPFAYFTTTCYNAFLQKIEKEKKSLYIKYKAIEQVEIFDALSDNHAYGERVIKGTDEGIPYSEGARDKRDEFVYAFEAKMNKDKEKKEKQKHEQQSRDTSTNTVLPKTD